MSLTFVLGAAGSGKTLHALAEADRLAAEAGGRRVLLATAPAPRAPEPGPGWTRLEVPLALPQAVASLLPRDVAVVDGLADWLRNLLRAEADVAEETQALIEALHFSPADAVILISDQVDEVAPQDGRLRDEMGWMHQAVAGAVDRMVVVEDGRAQVLKG